MLKNGFFFYYILVVKFSLFCQMKYNGYMQCTVNIDYDCRVLCQHLAEKERIICVRVYKGKGPVQAENGLNKQNNLLEI